MGIYGMDWFKNNIIGNLAGTLLGAILMGAFVLSGRFMGKQVQNMSQTWIPQNSISFSLSKECSEGWRLMGSTIVEVDSSFEAFLKTLEHPSETGSFYDDLNVLDQKGRTVEGWNLVKLYTCMKEPKGRKV